MAARFSCPVLMPALAALVALAAPAMAQEAAPAADSTSGAQLASWLQPAQGAPQTAPGESFHATTSPVATDPFAVVTSGALWEPAYGGIYTRDLGDGCLLSSQTTDVVFDEDGQNLSRSEKLALAFTPAPELTIDGNIHDTTSDSVIPQDAWTTTGAGWSAEGHLPTRSVVSVGMNFDRSISGASDAVVSRTRSYNAQVQQPLGQLPVSAVFKGELDDMSMGGAPVADVPSIEQSLVWKPLTNTTVQMGLRQQQYQEYPGVDHELNEAIFADLSEKVLDNVSWHSYAEVLNSKGLNNQAPGAPIASGANGTAQATTPGSNASLSSSLPLSLEDQTVTFSTGPSVQLQKDISASVEYSNRWDKNPAAGSNGQEQRVSVSVKGTF